MSKPVWFIALGAVLAVAVGFIFRRRRALTLAAIPLVVLVVGAIGSENAAADATGDDDVGEALASGLFIALYSLFMMAVGMGLRRIRG